ncbi:MAG TPA: glycosyltransferase family 1 protein, partial [Gammaproteobacteria bacterium]|nr:glycosyltransferase family 1 protein [Gammaproteobacteria bacterium]
PGVTGYLDEDLGRAARAALELDPADCRRAAECTSWRECTEAFTANLAPLSAPAFAAPTETGG